MSFYFQSKLLEPGSANLSRHLQTGQARRSCLASPLVCNALEWPVPLNVERPGRCVRSLPNYCIHAVVDGAECNKARACYSFPKCLDALKAILLG